MTEKAGNARVTGSGKPRVWKPAATGTPPDGVPPQARKDQMASPPDAPTGGDSTGRPVEIGGPPGPEPTRYGDWEKAGRCIDF